MIDDLRGSLGLEGLATYFLHQVISTLGVAFAAPFALIFFADLVRPFGWAISMRVFYQTLSGTPYFPIHIVLALFLGWVLGRLLTDRVMLFVWILPLAILLFFFATFPTNQPFVFSQSGSLSSPSSLSHFFGRGCEIGNHCFDQLLITMPFYASTAYSVGAWLAFRTGSAASHDNFGERVRRKRAYLFIGLPLLCVTLVSARLNMAARSPLPRMPTTIINIAMAFAEAWILTFLALILLELAGSPPALKRFFLKDQSAPAE